MAQVRNAATVQMDNLIILGNGPSQTVLLHENLFSNMRLYVHSKDCRVVVYGGVKGDCHDEERLRSTSSAGSVGDEEDQMEVEDVCPMLEYLQNQRDPPPEGPEGPATHYTYVALQFPSAYIKYHSTRQTTKIVIRWAHHITLAYLPWTTSRKRDNMEKVMNELLAGWIAIKPSLRPSCLLTSRSFVIGRRAGDFVGDDDDGPCAFDRWPRSDIYTSGRSDFINTKWEQICQLVDNNLLSFVCTPKEIVKKMETDGIDVVPPEFVKEVCAKYNDRECRRLHKASEIEKECRPKYHDEAVIEILLRAGQLQTNQ